jgi:hypothetical protein
MTKRFDIRTSYAGVDNSKGDLKKAEALGRKYASLKVRYVHDKGAALEMSDADFARYEAEMRNANLGYLIEDSAKDAN